MAYQYYKSYIFEVELQSLHVQDRGEELDVVGYLRMNLIHELYPVQFSWCGNQRNGQTLP